MPIYSCTYKNEDKKQLTKRVVAKTRSECIVKLSCYGASDIKVREIADLHGLEYILFSDIGGSSMKPKEMADFFDQLSFLIKSGMQLFQALESLGRAGDKQTKALCSKLLPMIAEGHTLDDALTKTKMFKPEIIYQVKAGSESGNVVSSLDRVSEDIKKRMELKSKTVTAAIYPAFMLVVLIAVTALMMTFIIPQIAKSFSDLGGELPKLTLFVIVASKACVKYGPVVILGITGLIWGIQIGMKYNGDFREVIHKLLLKIPLIGELMIENQLAQLCRVLSSLMECGIPLVQAVGISTDTVNNEYIKRKVKKIKHHIEVDGISLFSALKQVKGFPDMFCQLVDVGEKSGNITPVLNKLAGRYENHIGEMTKRIAALMEPLVIVLMVIIGGTVVIGMMLPVFTISDII